MNDLSIRRNITVYTTAFLFLAFGIWELIDPAHWYGYVPAFLFQIASAQVLVMMHGLTLTILGLWIASQRYLKYAALVGTAMLAEIVISLITTSGFSDILIRDATLMLFVFSLYFDNEQ